VVASIDTYIKYSEAVGQVVPASRPAVDTKTHEAVLAENQALRAQLGATDGAPVRRRRSGAGAGAV
jgi:hypothetical protein